MIFAAGRWRKSHSLTLAWRLSLSTVSWAICLLFASAPGMRAWAGPLDTWTLRQPPLIQDDLLHVAFFCDAFIALSRAGQILSSPDGTNWVVSSSGVEAPLVDVAFGNGRFVAVGSGYEPNAGPFARISVSNDGRSWIGTNADPLPALHTISFGGDLFVAFGAGATNDSIWTSADGFAWTQRPFTNTPFIGTVRHTAGQFLAAGGYAVGTFPGWEQHGVIVSSSDGVNWQTLLAGPGVPFGPIVAGEDGFLVGGRIMLRPLADGTWKQETSNSPSLATTAWGYGAGAFVFLAGTAFSAKSFDGVNWTVPAPLAGLVTDESGPPLHSIAFGRGTWVGVGPTGLIGTSTNAIRWQFGERATSLPLTSLCEGGGLLVAVGGETNNVGLRPAAGTILNSRDGQHWSRPAAALDQRLASVTFGASRFVAVGGDRQKNSGLLLMSEDGTNWSRSPLNPQMPLSRVVYGNGLFAAVGDNGAFPDLPNAKSVVVSSADGAEWNTRLVVDGQLYLDLVFGAGHFVLSALAPGMWRVLYSSTNLVTWEGPFPVAGDVGSGLSFGNGLFRVAGRGPGLVQDGIYNSPDASHWTFVATQEEQPAEVIAIPGRFVGLSGGRVVMSSFDGVHWDKRDTGSQLPLTGLGYALRKVFALGVGGTIFESGMVSPAFLSAPLLRSERTELFVVSEPGDSVTIESSGNLKTWSFLGTTTNMTGTVPFLAPAASGSKQLFYRARANPFSN